MLGNTGHVNYSSSKAAVIGVTRTPAKEWARYPVQDEGVIRPTTVRLGTF